MTAPDVTVHHHQQDRAFIAHKPKWQRYQPIKAVDCNTTYARQYAHVYHARLAALSKQIWRNLDDDSTSSKVRVERILDLVEGTEGSCVAGTLVREQDDHVLEDESGRVVLAGTEKYPIVTGVVAVLEGVVQEGVFHVAAMHVPNPASALEALAGDIAATSSQPPADKAKSLLLLSGMNCGDPDVSSLPRDMLLSFLQGCFGSDKAKTIGQVIVAGGLISPSPGASRAEALKDLDAWMLQTASCGVFVDVLPGKDDPTTANWPQRPMHASLLPQSTSLGNDIVHRTPNPYAAQLDDATLVVGTDGTNVQDLVQQLNSAPKGGAADEVVVSELDALELVLGWSHLCPNGPDAVPTVPHADMDPMVMDRVPSLLFCGNATQFATSTVGPCRLVCVPRFSATGQAVLVHLSGDNRPSSVEVLCFKAEEDSPN